MKINLEEVDKINFRVDEHVLNGETIYLIQPIYIGSKWQKNNLHFRSSVWNSQGELISAGFKKFFNWSEQPNISPIPTSLKKCQCVEKIDGSLLIVSKYKGNYIFRTRGTTDASGLKNGEELKIFKDKYLSKCSKFMGSDDTWMSSLLFEWTSPIQKIVLNYGSVPYWHLVGQVYHDDYALATQAALDQIGRFIECIRPNVYKFEASEELIRDVDGWKDREGVVVYSEDGQTLHKVKSAWYLVRHHMKSELSSLDKVVDFWVNSERPDYQELKDAIIKFDVELWAEPTLGFASRISDAWKEVQKIEEGMNRFVGGLMGLCNRKLQAEQIISSYGNTNRAVFCFKILDGKKLGSEDYKKLLYQVLKK